MMPIQNTGRAPSRQGQLVPGYQRDPGSDWIAANRSTLPNNEWVAANQSGLVATDSSYDGLMALVRAKHLDPAEVAVAFISLDAL